MAFVFHIHPSPSCEATHHTACASIDGSDWDHSCIQIASGDVTEGSSGVYIGTLRVSVTKKRFLSLT